MREIRGKAPAELANILRQKLDAEQEVFASNDRLRLHQQNYGSPTEVRINCSDVQNTR